MQIYRLPHPFPLNSFIWTECAKIFSSIMIFSKNKSEHTAKMLKVNFVCHFETVERMILALSQFIANSFGENDSTNPE